jgi:hypothetical protein
MPDNYSNITQHNDGGNFEEVEDAMNAVSEIAMMMKVAASADAGECINTVPLLLFLIRGEDGTGAIIGRPVVIDDESRASEDVGEALEASSEVIDEFAYHVMNEIKQVPEGFDSFDAFRASLGIDYVALATDSFVRFIKSNEVDPASLNKLVHGDLAQEFDRNPFTDIKEGLTIHLFGHDGVQANGFVEYRRGDDGLPVFVEKTMSQGMLGSIASGVAMVMRSFMEVCPRRKGF